MLTIQGLGFSLNTASYEVRSSALSIFNSTEVGLYNLTFQGGDHVLWRSVCSYYSSITVASSLFRGNAGNNGGAIFTLATKINIVDSKFIANRAESDGGAIYAFGTEINIVKSMFIANSAECNGGAIYGNYSSLTVEGTQFENNSAIRGRGGGVYLIRSPQQVFVTTTVHGTFTGNSAKIYGGGVYISYASNVTLSGIFTANTGQSHGGAVFATYNENLIFRDITATSNSVTGIFISYSHVVFSGTSSIGSNSGILGGGLFAKLSSLSFTGNTAFDGNVASRNGGAIYSLYGTMSLDANARFTFNTAHVGGGALYAIGTGIHFKKRATFEFNVAKDGGVMYFWKFSLFGNSRRYKSHIYF